MEKKDYYSLKEIILGLYDEQKKHQQDLQKLKKLCIMDKKRVVDFRFHIYQPEKKKPILLCEYEPRQNQIQKIATEFSKKTGYYIYGKHTAYLVTDNNKYYFLNGNERYPVGIRHDYGMEEEFYNQVNSILNSRFANNMNSKYIEKNCSNIDAGFTISTRDIELYIRNSSDKIPCSLVRYNPSDETLMFKSFEGSFNAQSMTDVLSTNFPISELNQYHIEMISTSEKTEEPISLEYNGTTKAIKLNMQEEEKQFVLRKYRK